MTHHQRVNGDVDFSALDLPDFLIRDRERRGNPKVTLASRVDIGKNTDPMKLSAVMAADYSPPPLWRIGLVAGLRRSLAAVCVIGLVSAGYIYIAGMWHH